LTYQPGNILLDKYRIQELVGRGAFAEVYKVTHLSLNVTRAIKVLHRETPGVGSTEFKDYHERFELEARLGAKLNTPTPHPNLLQVFDFMQAGDLLVLEMEYASGGSLYNRIQKAKAEDKPLQVEETLQMAIDVAEGLSAVHAVDAVHRDLKPTNILFDAQDCAKLADLGLAQVPGGPSMRTQLGSMAPRHPGTPGYMSPEQEDTSKYLKPASDIYALGLVLFEILTGRNYSNLKTGTRAKSLRPNIPTWLDDLIAGLLEKDPENRPWDCRELAVLLRQGKERQVRRLSSKSWESQLQQIQKLWPKVALGLLVLLLLVLLASSVIAFFVFRYWNDQQIVQIESTESRIMNSSEIQISETKFPSVTSSQFTITFTPSIPTQSLEQAETQKSKPTGTVIPSVPSQTLVKTNTPTFRLTATMDSPKPPASASVGDTWLSPIDGMTMVYVPEGEFFMGARSSDSQSDEDEKPQHTVYLDAFWIDQTNVTNNMYAKFLNENGNQLEGGTYWYDSEGAFAEILQKNGVWKPTNDYKDISVYHVTWYGVQAYCKWAGRRLPTEAEWEKSARGTNYIYIDSWSNVHVSPYGALDMIFGEWVADWYNDSYYSFSPRENPTGPESGEFKVVRGGTVDYSVVYITSRYPNRPNQSRSNFGFRCARSP